MVSSRNMKASTAPVVLTVVGLSLLVGSASAACELFWPAAAGDTCALMASDWLLTLDEFIALNPSVGPGCAVGVRPGEDYCVAGTPDAVPTSTPPAPNPGPTTTRSTLTTTTASTRVTTGPLPGPTTFTTLTTTATTTRGPVSVPTTTSTRTSTTTTSTSTASNPAWPSPVQDGVIPECKHFYLVVEGDNCDVVARKHANSFTVEQFMSWNTKVGEDCQNLWKDSYSCVGVGPTAPPVVELPPDGPAKIQPGTTPYCTDFYEVRDDETCDSVFAKYPGRFPKEQFFQWNPEVGGEACDSLWGDGYSVCVGASKRPVANVQPGVVSNCNDFWKVQDGRYCSAIVELFKGRFTLAQFLSWNTEAGGDCSNLWTDYYVCVGTA